MTGLSRSTARAIATAKPPPVWREAIIITSDENRGYAVHHAVADRYFYTARYSAGDLGWRSPLPRSSRPNS
jgi:hypothetical protein